VFLTTAVAFIVTGLLLNFSTGHREVLTHLSCMVKLVLNVLVARYALLLHIQQVLGLNIDPKTSYLD
jgi:hypothetical protein